MNNWSTEQLRELIRVEICAERRLRDALRKADRERIDDALDALDKALRLQASGVSSAQTALFQVLGVFNTLLGLWLAYLLYAK